MPLNVAGQAGPQNTADGAGNTIRQGRTAELIVADAYGHYHEPATRSLIYAGSTALGGVAVAAGMVSPVAAGATPLMGIYNPIGSAVFLSIIRVVIASITGAPNGTGMFAYNLGFNQVITTGTPGQCSAGLGTGKGKFFNGATAMTGSSALVLYRPVPGIVNFAGTIATTSGPLQFNDEIAGEIVLPPGGVCCLAVPGAGTSWVVGAGMSWIETPFLGSM